MMSQSEDGAPLSFIRLIIIFGMIWAVTGFVVIPLFVAMAYRRGWIFLVNVVWLMLPAITLLTSLKYWFTGRRAGAVADAIVSCGVAFVWLFVMVAGMVGKDLGLLPYVLSMALLIFTAWSFWAFTHSVSEDDPVTRSLTLSWTYWVIFITTILVMGITCGLVFYSQIIAG